MIRTRASHGQVANGTQIDYIIRILLRRHGGRKVARESDAQSTGHTERVADRAAPEGGDFYQRVRHASIGMYLFLPSEAPRLRSSIQAGSQ